MIKIDKNDLQKVVEYIRHIYGYDFSNYSSGHVQRRIIRHMELQDIIDVDDFLLRLKNKDFFGNFLLELSINVSEFYRDSEVYKLIQSQIIPYLASFPFIKIWHAGCSCGEEVYSLAILLHEAGILDRCQIYATDFNRLILDKARLGQYKLKEMRDANKRYLKSGGIGNLSDHYLISKNKAVINENIKEKILFTEHNLATDNSFGVMNFILCRNVLIYFNKDLQNRTFKLFTESLENKGFLCLGTKESTDSSNEKSFYQIFGELENKIYRKIIK